MGIETVAMGLGGLLLGAMNKAPDIPAPAKPEPAPQASQTPDANVVRQNAGGTGQAGGSPGIAQTLLTGAGGVEQSSLQLGKKTLLGG